MKLTDNYLLIKEKIAEIAFSSGRDPSQVHLLAVSKGRSLEEIKALYDAGCRDFGENRVPEALEKMGALPSDIRWHMIGNMQKNKVNKAIGKFALIHSVDTPELAKKISDSSVESNIKTSILLQVNASGEPSKHGLSPEAWQKAFQEILHLPGVSVEGLMTMAPLTENVIEIRHCFANLRILKEALNIRYNLKMSHLSMGMSHDYPIAIEEGATIIRVGSALFKVN